MTPVTPPVTQPVILGIAGPSLTDDERHLLSDHAPRGIILFSRNIHDQTQLSDLNAELKSLLPPDGILMVDQEGGRVARLRPPHWPALPPAGTLRTAQEAYGHGRELGAMVKAAGFTMTAAPVLDLSIEGANGIIGDRAISGDPAQVALLGGEIARGIMDEGILPVMKHIPGHGRALLDSHLVLPRVAVNDEDDHFPFIRNQNLPWAMTAHIVYEQWDAERPATISPIVIQQIIRGKIGFKGQLMSDDLAMHALEGTPKERALAALEAGCDVALYCPGEFAGNRQILEAL
ncbi:MAG TPA: beta-N-acetylhexosaminidase [Acidocella sp.]|jgi:beta-N-acetylhexosaminidase|nr:beta-N-acetylhexosaminidase [Acidocella sp.]